MGKSIISLNLSGQNYLLKKLQTMGHSVFNKVGRTAVTKGCRPITTAARKNLRSRKKKSGSTGMLAKSITQVVRTYQRKWVVMGIVGPDKAIREEVGQRAVIIDGKVRSFKPRMQWPAMYAHLVEGPTKPHKIPIIKDGRVSGYWNHPGTKAQPWLTPAVEQQQAHAFSIVAEELAAGIEREAARA